MRAGGGPTTERPRGADVWTHVRGALQAAQDWRGVDHQRLADLETAVTRAQGQPDRFAPADARDILEVVLDGRSARQFPSGRHGQRKATLLGLERLLRPTADRAPQVTGLLPPEPEPAQPASAPPESAPVSLPEPAPPPAPPEPAAPPARGEGVDLRPYQREYVTTTVLAMRASTDPNFRIIGGGHKDRGVLVSPYQTGKSTVVVPVANAARQIFPGKKILIISPLKIITRQMVGDMVEGFEGTIGVVDATYKEFNCDVTIASAYTLARNLKDINPDEYGLVVVDEMLYSFAPTWQKILNRLGFVDAHGSITPTSGKFLLGLGAGTKRGDGRDVRRIFGTQVLANLGLTWFVKEGYLHNPLGLEASYGQSADDSEVVRREDETIVVMRDSPKNRAHIIDTYDRHLHDRKAVIFTVRVSEARHLADDFNKRFGAGYAGVVVGETPDAEADEIVDRFNAGTGPKVLITVRRLAIGARLKGVAGVIFNHKTNSRDKFAQAASRGLARLPDEPQRGVLVITMEGKGHLLDAPQSAATLAGFEGTTPADEVYEPLKLARSLISEAARRRRSRRGVAVLRAGAERVRDLRAGASTFTDELQKVLREKFGGDISRMAKEGRIEPAALQSYLHEKLPRSLAEVLALAARLQVDFEVFERAWIADMRAHLDFEYPVPDKLPEAARGLTELIRLAAIRQTPDGTVSALERYIGVRGTVLQDYLCGELPVTEEPLKRIFEFIVESGAADESAARQAIGGYAREKKIMAGTLAEYVDVLDLWDGERVSPGIAGRESPERAMVEADLAEQTRRALGSLTPREEQVMRALFEIGPDGERGAEGVVEESEERPVGGARYGVDTDDEPNFEAVGKKVGITGSSVRQIEEKALRKLRHPSRANRLKPFLFEASSREPLLPAPRISNVVQTRIELARALFLSIRSKHRLSSAAFQDLLETMSTLTNRIGDGFIRLQMEKDSSLTVKKLARINTPWEESDWSGRFDDENPWLIESEAPTLVDFWNGVIAIFKLAEVRGDSPDSPQFKLAQTAARNLRGILETARITVGGEFRVCYIDVTVFKGSYPLRWRNIESGLTNVDIMTFGAAALAENAARVAKNATVNFTAGGVTFAIGDYFSNTILGRPNPSFTEFVQYYTPLAVGGGSGKVLVDGALRVWDGGKFFAAYPAMFDASPSLSRALTKRTVPLFLALALQELATTGRVNVKDMPRTIANIMIASGITKGMGTVALKSNLVKRVAQAMKLIRVGGTAAAPETAGTTLAGAALASVVEFTILKVLADWEEEWNLDNGENMLRAGLADAIKRSNAVMEKQSRGEDIDMASIISAERAVFAAEMRLMGYIERERIGPINAKWKQDVDEQNEEELATFAQPLDEMGSRAGVREFYDRKHKEINKRYAAKLAVLEDSDRSRTYKEIDLTNPSPNVPAWMRAFGIFASAHWRYDEASELISVRSQHAEKLARNIEDLSRQMESYHRRRNEFWTEEARKVLREQMVAMADLK